MILTNTQVSVHWSISCSSCQILSISIRDVLTSLRVSKPFCEAKIDNVNVVLLLSDTNKEIIWLDISVEEVSRVNELYSLKLKQVISLLSCFKKVYLPFNQRASALSWAKTCVYNSWTDLPSWDPKDQWPSHYSHLLLRTSGHLECRLN